MAEYDPDVIHKFADRLYSRATSIVVTYTLTGALVGGGFGFTTTYYLSSSQAPIFIVLGLLLLGALGYAIGSERAFLLRLQAQTALCQVQIEQNTHPPDIANQM